MKSLFGRTVGALSERPALLLIFGTLFWGINFPVGRFIAITPELANANQPTMIMGAVELAMWRWGFASLILILFFRPYLGEAVGALKDHWLLLTGLALASVAGFNTLVYWGLTKTVAINATLINIMMPIFIMILGPLLFGDRVSRANKVSIVLGFIGLLLIVSKGDVGVLLGLRLNAGDLIIIFAMLVYALYSLFLRKRPALSAPALMCALILIGWPFLFVLSLTQGIETRPWDWSFALWGLMLFLGLCPSILSILCWNNGVQKLGATQASLFILLTPVFGTITAILLLGERLALFHIAALLIIAFAIWLSYADQKRNA